eukprot:9494004-Pyramimonas_sp.AAC.1
MHVRTWPIGRRQPPLCLMRAEPPARNAPGDQRLGVRGGRRRTPELLSPDHYFGRAIPPQVGQLRKG